MSQLLPRFRDPLPLRHRPSKVVACSSGKRVYATAEIAADALVRVRHDRALRPDGREPEERIYECPLCERWHLSSSPRRDLGFDLVPFELRKDGESWESYAGRLEKRIKAQRDQLLSLHALGKGTLTNKQTRRRIEALVVALGQMTERWEKERRDRMALVVALEEARSRRPRFLRRRAGVGESA